MMRQIAVGLLPDSPLDAVERLHGLPSQKPPALCSDQSGVSALANVLPPAAHDHAEGWRRTLRLAIWRARPRPTGQCRIPGRRGPRAMKL